MLVYPGATHRRFEHSLGTMHLASRVYEVVTRSENVTDEIRALLPETVSRKGLEYWRGVIRMAGLCHDLGHLPFSHAAEELLPEEWNHELLSVELILSEEMRAIWNAMTPPLRAEDIAKLAVGKRKAPRELSFSLWEEVLSEIIVGDAFGVDRMDYLLRDSLHAGVQYGHFDHDRLTDSLRILPVPPRDDEEEKMEGGARPPALGVEYGGLRSAEQLLLARYFMFSQVYFHPVRRAYDLHLVEFLKQWLPDGVYSTDLDRHLAMTDNEVFAAIWRAAGDEELPGSEHAKRIRDRSHFKLLYERKEEEAARNPDVVERVRTAAAERFGEGSVLADEPSDIKKAPDFPVLSFDGSVVSSLTGSDLLKHTPVISSGYVYIRPDLRPAGLEWLAGNRAILTAPAQEDRGGGNDDEEDAEAGGLVETAE